MAASGLQKVDPESPEFKEELEKTIKFTDKVLTQFGFVYNPDAEINQSVQFGLTRNKMIYGKRFCPCFFVTGDKEEDRICPCKPALSHEIPDEGHCHCGIFCTPEFAQANQKAEALEEAVHAHSRGLTKPECEALLSKALVDSDELGALLEARELGMVAFRLVDTREWMEWKGGHIKGTDLLCPTTSFYDAVKELEGDKQTPVVVYCHSGSRSAYCQQVLKDMKFESVTNLQFGIVGYRGEIVQG